MYATDAFLELGTYPYQVTDASMSIIERSVVILYHRTSNLSRVNDARQDLFSKRSRTLENIPPTQAALLQHTVAYTRMLTNSAKSCGLGMGERWASMEAMLDNFASGKGYLL